ncbi:hypothetical protein CBOM_05208 [Ceraceosorus bombacis]|uniref:Uncharacterized protein n=1 Tax=Ceraceosorus bombacis TaxID=401625 RepID=A0A0P1BIC3_9BASI|nr:hypothetical protein CBOM_05208 [Ceraceosorus bombacis]
MTRPVDAQTLTCQLTKQRVNRRGRKGTSSGRYELIFVSSPLPHGTGFPKACTISAHRPSTLLLDTSTGLDLSSSPPPPSHTMQPILLFLFAFSALASFSLGMPLGDTDASYAYGPLMSRDCSCKGMTISTPPIDQLPKCADGSRAQSGIICCKVYTHCPAPKARAVAQQARQEGQAAALEARLVKVPEAAPSAPPQSLEERQASPLEARLITTPPEQGPGPQASCDCTGKDLKSETNAPPQCPSGKKARRSTWCCDAYYNCE